MWVDENTGKSKELVEWLILIFHLTVTRRDQWRWIICCIVSLQYCINSGARQPWTESLFNWNLLPPLGSMVAKRFHWKHLNIWGGGKKKDSGWRKQKSFSLWKFHYIQVLRKYYLKKYYTKFELNFSLSFMINVLHFQYF